MNDRLRTIAADLRDVRQVLEEQVELVATGLPPDRKALAAVVARTDHALRELDAVEAVAGLVDHALRELDAAEPVEDSPEDVGRG